MVRDAEAERTVRNSRHLALWAAFKSAKVAKGETPAATEAWPIVNAAVRFVAKTPAQLTLLPLEDALGLERQPGMYPELSLSTPTGAIDTMSKPASILDETNVRHRIAKPGQSRRAMNPLNATMRLQFNSDFTFHDARSPYLVSGVIGNKSRLAIDYDGTTVEAWL